MKKHTKSLVAVVAALSLAGSFALFGCSGGSGEAKDEPAAEPAAETVELQIFAANSLQKALDEVQSLYTEQTGVTFGDTQYKGSGDLVKEMQGGAPCDILITASKSTMDTAEKDALVSADSRFDMFTNDLVIVKGANNTDVPDDLTFEQAISGDYKIALGNDNVPAGNYSRQSISTVVPCATIDGKTGKETDGKVGDVEGAGFAGTMLDGKIVVANSVGDACNYAATGEADIAFVYTSDVARYQDQVKQLVVVDASTHKNIVYPAAVSSSAKAADAAQAFLDWATTDAEALKIWQKWGFELA